jgi:sporulation integral membrane protein YlbJ
MQKKTTGGGRLSPSLLATGAIFFTVSMIFYPKEAFEAAVVGLDVWWRIVFPALLPFFIGSEILMGLGVVHFMGVLLEPLMRPVFNVPGTGSFVMAMGLASGYPIGAILTARLRREELCSKVEGERLLGFTNTADPLFMFGAVAVGMFGYPQIGLTIAAAHYLASVTTGLALRFYGCSEANTPEDASSGNMIVKAVRALYRAREKDARPFGQLMGDAVRNSVNTLLLIGGFIILFSVIIRVLTVLGVVGLLSRIMMFLLMPLGLEPALIPALISGLFEITLGCQLAGQVAPAVPIMQKTMVAGAIIAWSGLSVHAQVASLITGTGMRMFPYIVSRFIHAVLAAVYTYVLMGPLSAVFYRFSIPAFLQAEPEGSAAFILERTTQVGWRFLLICALLTGAGLLTAALRRFCVRRFLC